MQDKIVTPQASSLYASFFNRGNQIQKRRYLQAQVTYQIKARPRRYKISRYASFFYGGIPLLLFRNDLTLFEDDMTPFYH